MVEEAASTSGAAPAGPVVTAAVSDCDAGSFTAATGLIARHARTAGVVRAHAGIANNASRAPKPPPYAGAKPA